MQNRLNTDNVDENLKIACFQNLHVSCQYRNSLKMLDFKWISQKNPSLSRNGVSIAAYALRYG